MVDQNVPMKTIKDVQCNIQTSRLQYLKKQYKHYASNKNVYVAGDEQHRWTRQIKSVESLKSPSSYQRLMCIKLNGFQLEQEVLDRAGVAEEGKERRIWT